MRFVIRESEFHTFARLYPTLRGFDFVEQVLDYFDFSSSAIDREREHIPAWGRVVIIANHPIGSLDALALLKMVGQVRPDVKIVANDLLQFLEPLQPLLLPVDNMGGKTCRENIRAIEAHLQNEGAVIIFPAGEVSRISAHGIRDGQWNAGFLRFASRARAPVLPVCIDAHNSAFFYGLSIIAKPLSTLWLVREMFKHTSNTVSMRIGLPIGAETYQHLKGDFASRTKAFKHHVYKVGKGHSAACFRNTCDSVAHPENRQALREALHHCQLLGTTREGLQVRLYHVGQDCTVLRELGRLREISFRAVGEGTGRKRDTDEFDQSYEHLVLWDDVALEIVGAYRMRKVALHGAADTLPDMASRLYTNTLFEYLPAAEPFLQVGVELGRSFVQPRYWRQNGLDLLWRGIGSYLKRHPEVRYLFGPVSISARFPTLAQALLVSFYSHYFPASQVLAIARTPCQSLLGQELPDWSAMDYRTGMRCLKNQLAQMGLAVPPLFKQYSELCEDQGVQFTAFNTDACFANCVDGLVIVDLSKIKTSRRKRYLAHE